jgi:hypothetical protein
MSTNAPTNFSVSFASHQVANFHPLSTWPEQNMGKYHIFYKACKQMM